MSNRLGTLGALVLAIVAMVCGTVLMVVDKLDAASAWPSLLAAVIVPSMGILLGQRIENVSQEQAAQKTAVEDVRSKVNGRMTELIATVAQLADRLGVDPELSHPENRAALAEARPAVVPAIPAARGTFSPTGVIPAADASAGDVGEDVAGPTD